MPRSTKSGGVYIEISGNIEPFKKQLELAQELAKKTSRNLQNATEGFFNEHQIKKITDSLSRNLLNVRATAISCQKDISLFGRHFEQIAQKIGLAGEQAKIFGKDIENALKNAKEKSLERSMRSLQQQIGLTDQAYMRLASSMGATEAAMKKAESVLNVRTYSQIKDEIKRVAEAYNQFVKSGKAAPNDIKRAHDAATKAIRQLGVELRSTTNEFRKEEKAAKSLLDRIGKSTLIFAGGFLTTHAIVQSLKDIVTGSIEASTALNRLELAYSSIYQGASNGKVQLQYIYEQAIKTGQEYVSLAESAKTFFAAGQNSTIKNEMNDIFESVNLAGAALQLSAAQMQRVYYAIGQMISKGKVSAEEMRQQLGEQLPGAFQIAAKAMGVTTAELDKMMADGKLMTEDFLPKFSKAIKEQYGEAGLKASDTLQGAINRVKTEFELLKASFVDSDSMTQALKGVASGLTALKSFVESGTLGAIAKGLGAAGVAAIALNPRIVALGTSFVTALNTSALATKGFTAALTGMFTVLRAHPIMAVVTAIGALTTAYSLLTEETDKAKESQEKLNKSQEAYTVVEKVLNNTSSTLHEYSESITIAEQNIKSLNEQTLNIPPTLEALSNSLYDAEGNVTSLEREFQELIRSYKQTNDIEKFNEELRIFAQKAKESSSKTDELSKAIETAQKIAKQGIDLHVSLTGFETALSKLKQLFTFGKHGIQFDVSKMGDTEDAAYSKNMQKLVNDTFSHTNEYNNAAINQQITTLKEYREYLDTDAGKVGLLDNPEVVKSRIDANIKYLEGKLKGLKENKPKGNGSGSKAANAQEDYNALLKKTNAELEGIEEKFKYNSAEKVQKKINDVTTKYNVELGEIEKNINKMLNSKKITAAQAAALEKAQKELALKKKNLALQELQEKLREQEMQHLQTQIGFYNELAELNGQYENSAQLRIRLIELEAKKFENIEGIPKEMIEEWKKFKQLQASTDPFDGALRGLKKFTAEYGDSAKQWENLTYNFAKDFEQNIHNMFDEFIDTGKISFDNMAQLFKNLLKQMAYQALVQPIVLSVVNGVTGAVMGTGTATAGTGIAGAGQSASGLLTGAATSLVQNAVMAKVGGGLMNAAGGFLNSTAASLFPSTFAPTTAAASVNTAANAASLVTGGAANLPTQTATSVLGSGWTMGAGLVGGLLGSQVIVPALGIKEGTGTSVGGMLGGAGGTLGGALLGAQFGSVGGPIGAGLGALAGTVLGALGGSLFGGGYEDEPGYYINTYTDLTKKEGLAGYKQGTAIQNHRWDSFSDSTASAMRDKVARPLMTQLRENTVALHEQIVALGGKDLGESFFDAVRKNQGSGDKRTGKGGIELSDYFHIHGEWHDTNSPDVEKWAEQIGEQYQKVIVKSIANMDMKPIAVAADGMVANTEEEIAIALAKAGSLISVGDAIEDEELKKSFEKGINKSLIAALKSIDTKGLGLTIDKSSLAGWQTAIQAMALWSEVNTTIENMLEPASEISVQFKSIGNQFETWKNSLEALGWQSKKINEIDKKRIEYVKKYADETMNGFEKQDEYITRVKEINEAFADVYKGMRDNGISQSDLNNVNSRRDAVLREYIDGILEPFRENDEIKKNIQSISDTFVSAIAAMKEASNTFTDRDIKNAQSKMSTVLRKYVSSVTDSYKKTNTLQKSIDEINNVFDDLIAGMKAVGMNTKDLTNAEKQRSQALAQLISDTMKSYDQSLYLRYLSLNSGSDSSTYQLSQLVFTQQNELEDLANAIGKNNDEYKTTELIQQAEMLNTRINLLQNQLKNTLENELTTATEILNTATSIRTTFESILRSLKQARQNLWTSDKNLATSRYDEANKQFNEVFAKAMSGDEEALKELPNIANTVLSLAKEQLNTRGEYDTAFYTISKKLKKAEDVAASQLLTAEKDIDVQQSLVASLNAEINGLGNTVGDAMEQSSEALRSLITTYQTQLTGLLKTIAENSTTISNNTAKIALLNDGTSESKKAILETKSELMKYGEALGKGQEAGNYTSDYILQAIAANGMTFDEWYTKYGSKEIIEAAKNTGTVINSISDLHKITDAYDKLLVDKANALNSSLYTTANVAAGGWTADLVRAEIASRGMTVKEWYDKYGKSEGFLLGTKNNTGSLNETLKAHTSSVNMSFTSWEDLLQKKADAMNAGLTLAGKQATGGWTADLVRQEIASRGMTVQEWYAKYGKAEGFLQSTSTNTKITGDNVKTYTLSEGEKILAVKTALMNMGQTLSAGQKSSGNTMQSVLAEIEANGMTFNEWYTKYGKKEIDEAATNAGYIVGSTASMDEYTQSLLSSQTGVLSGWLSDVNKSVKSLQLDPSITNNFTPGITFSPTINVKVDQNGNVKVDKTVNDTSTSTSSGKTTTTTTNNNTSNNNTTTPKKISETVSSLSDTYKKALQTKTDAMVQGYLLASGQTMKNYTTAEVLKMINDTGYTFADWYKKYGDTEIKSLQKKTTKSTKYSSDYALLVAKADAMNKKKEQGRTNWRASTALAEIQSKGLTLASWYDKYGKAEGFFKGGITPKNRAYWVGEKGPELLMSPQNYGILSNKDSMELMRGNSQNIYTSTGSVTTLDGGDKETHNILKQLLRKLTSQEYKIEKMQRIFDTWNHEGLPATATA